LHPRYRLCGAVNQIVPNRKQPNVVKYKLCSNPVPLIIARYEQIKSIVVNLRSLLNFQTCKNRNGTSIRSCECITPPSAENSVFDSKTSLKIPISRKSKGNQPEFRRNSDPATLKYMKILTDTSLLTKKREKLEIKTSNWGATKNVTALVCGCCSCIPL
jgi:hypothetical protein